MPHYKLRTNFKHIKGDSWDPSLLTYRESFIEETLDDYQLIGERNLTLIPSNDQVQGLAFDPQYARNYPELQGYNFDRTSIAFGRYNQWARIDRDLYILNAKADRLLRDFDIHETKIIKNWHDNNLNQIGTDFLSLPERTSGSAYLERLADYRLHWESYPEILQIKKQLKFEKEVFYWSNIKAFERDYDQAHNEPLVVLRNKYYESLYQPIKDDRPRNITPKPWNRVWNIQNPFEYPSQDHYRYWSNSRDDYYINTHTAEDEYWDIEANYFKQLNFAAPWTEFVNNWKRGTIPNDSVLRLALDQERNSRE